MAMQIHNSRNKIQFEKQTGVNGSIKTVALKNRRAI